MASQAGSRVLAGWFAGAALAAGGLLIGVLVVASLDRGYEQVLTLQPPFAGSGTPRMS